MRDFFNAGNPDPKILLPTLELMLQILIGRDCQARISNINQTRLFLGGYVIFFFLILQLICWVTYDNLHFFL